MAVMESRANKIIKYGFSLFLIIFVACPLAGIMFYFGGAGFASILGIVVLILLAISTLFYYKKIAKWFKAVKPKLGKVGYCLLAINLGGGLVIFTYLVLLLLSFASLFGTAYWMFPTDWWGFNLIFSGWTLLVLINTGLLFCSSIALWIYLKLKDNKLKRQQKAVNNTLQLSSAD